MIDNTLVKIVDFLRRFDVPCYYTEHKILSKELDIAITRGKNGSFAIESYNMYSDKMFIQLNTPMQVIQFILAVYISREKYRKILEKRGK